MTSSVLVIDNNPMNLEFISYLLAAKGYAVRTAPSVDEGLDLMTRFTPCLIISDLNLPQRSGYDFLKKIKQRKVWRDIPFVLISATSWLQSDVERAQQLGAAKFIFRPIEPQALLDEIEPYLTKCNYELGQ